MRRLNLLGLTAAAIAAYAAPVSAQGVGGTVTTVPGSGTTSTATGTGTSAVGGGSISGLGGTDSGTTTTLGDSSLSTPAINALVGAGTTPQALSPSNVFGGYYGNPYFQGLPKKAGSTNAPGGFGVPLFGTTGTTAGGGQGAAAGGGTGRTTGLGAAGGFGTTAGGRGGAAGGQANAQNGVVVPLPRQISYTATLKFNAPIATMPQIATDLQATLGRSEMVAGAAGIITTTDGSTVVLSGTVASEDDARLAEGMARLTPGVRDVRNELKVLPPSP